MPEKIFIKTTKDLRIMAEGGKKLARIKKRLKEKINVGMNAGHTYFAYEDPNYMEMIRRGTYWAMKRDIPPASARRR